MRAAHRFWGRWEQGLRLGVGNADLLGSTPGSLHSVSLGYCCLHTLLVGRQTVLDKRLALEEEEGDVHPRT